MDNKFPKIIKDVGFDFSWDVKKVWKLDVPSEEMDIKELVWHFNIPFLWIGGERYNLKPQEVIDNPNRYKKEYRRTMKSNTDYPIDIMMWREQWLILDGLHRLMKKQLQGKDKVIVRKIDTKYIPDIEK